MRCASKTQRCCKAAVMCCRSDRNFDIWNVKQRRQLFEKHRTVKVVVVRAFAGPRQTDQAPPLRETRAPARDIRIRRRHIRNVSGNGRRFCPAYERQAEHRTVNIERRHWITMRGGRRDAGHCRKETHKLGLDFEQDPGAAFCQQWRVAHELDGVAAALFGMQEDGLALQRLASRPHRDGEIPSLRGLEADRPACFIAAPAAKIAQRQPHDAFDKLRLREVRLERERPARVHQRFLRPVEPAQRDRAVGQELRMDLPTVGRSLQRPIVGSQRLIGTIKFKQGIAAIAERIAMAGIAAEYTVEALQRFGGAAQFEECHAAPVDQLDIAGCKAQPLVKADQRTLELAERMEHKAEAGKTLGAGKVRLQRGLTKGKRRVKPPAPVIDPPEPVQRVEIVRLLLQNGCIKPLRSMQIAVRIRAQRAAQQTPRIGVRKLRWLTHR